MLMYDTSELSHAVQQKTIYIWNVYSPLQWMFSKSHEDGNGLQIFSLESAKSLNSFFSEKYLINATNMTG
jgi:hypothetical protein